LPIDLTEIRYRPAGADASNFPDCLKGSIDLGSIDLGSINRRSRLFEDVYEFLA
jgi:hypothetical protein